MKDVALDTSTVSLLLREPARTKALAQRLFDGSSRLLVSMTVLDELLARQRDSAVLAAAADLARFLRAFSGMLTLSFGVHELCRAEARRPLKWAPAFGIDALEETCRRLDEAVSRGDASVYGLNRAREAVAPWKAIDGQLAEARENRRAAFRNRCLDASEVGNALSAYGGDDLPERAYLAVLGRAGVRRLTPAAIIRDSSRYHAIRAYAALLRLKMLGDVIPPELMTKHPYLDNLRSDRNNYYDCLVASSAAYADVFLVEDRRLREKCRHLKDTGLVGFVAMNLENLEREMGLAPDRRATQRAG